MRQRLSAFLLVAPVIILSPAVSAGSPDPVAGYQRVINDMIETTHRWEALANWSLAFTAAAVVAGILVSLLQNGTRPWYKTATIGLGAVVALLTGLKPILFSADYRVLQRSATQGRRLVTELELKLSKFDPSQTPENLAAFDLDFLARSKTFDAIEDSISADANPKVTTTSLNSKPDMHAPKKAILRFPDLVVTAYAQSPNAQMVQGTASNDSSFFFTGQASSTSLSEAQQAARKEAAIKAGRFFVERTKALDPKADIPQALLDAIIAASKTAKSSYDYDRDKRMYTFSIQLQVSKGLEKLDLQRFRDPEVIVVATNPWKDTGIAVHKGEVISFTATGHIQWAKDPNTAVGPDGSESKIKPFPKPYPVRGFGAGGLIARVGTGEPFKVGTKAEVVMTSSGTLSLGINDNSFGDNQGEFHVTIVKLPPKQ